MKQIILSALALVCFSSQSWAIGGVGVAVVGAATFQKYTTSPTLNFDRMSGFPGGGVLLEAGLGDFQIQSGLLYLQHKTGFSILGFEVAQTQQTLQVPVLLRFGILPGLSLGAGGYASRFVGNPTLELRGVKTDLGHEVSMDYGLLASVAFALPLGLYDILIDGRYAHGLTDIDSDPRDTSRLNEFQILAGLRLEIGI